MLVEAVSQKPCDLILFGTLGDLASRKLLPALYQLEQGQLLHSQTRIIGCALDELSSPQYIDRVKTQLMHTMQDVLDDQVWSRFMSRLAYCQLDLQNHADYKKLLLWVTPNERIVISYCAIPPALYTQACAGLSSCGLNQQPARVVLEKPIGHDLASSIKINEQVAAFFQEDQIYRIDHYLGKETVQNLLVLRFANALFSLNWDNKSIDKVAITVAEEVGVEGRWSYYDKAGQARDMLQNHLLQILALVAMEPPLSLAAENIRQEKLKVLEALRPIREHNVRSDTVRGQYTSCTVYGEKIPGYLEEEGATLSSLTETFVGVKAYIDNVRWSGVPFHLQTGKKLAKKQSEIVIYFKSQADGIYAELGGEQEPNQLIIRLQPDEGMALNITNKIPGLGSQLALHNSTLDLNFNHLFKRRIPEAYERLLLEVMLGNQYLFVCRAEIEQAWKWIDGIKSAWEQQNIPLETYPAGSWGPERMRNLFSRQAHVWSKHNESA